MVESFGGISENIPNNLGQVQVLGTNQQMDRASKSLLHLAG